MLTHEVPEGPNCQRKFYTERVYFLLQPSWREQTCQLVSRTHTVVVVANNIQ